MDLFIPGQHVSSAFPSSNMTIVSLSGISISLSSVASVCALFMDQYWNKKVAGSQRKVNNGY